MFQIKINDYKVILAFIAFFLFISKWALAFIYFPFEDINLKIIFEIQDSLYLPLIKTLSNFDLNPSYSLDESNLNIIPFPYGSLILFSIFLKIFGSYSFIFIEYFGIFMFLIIFFQILTRIGLDKLNAILFSTFLFILPIIFKNFADIQIHFFELLNLNFQTFYSLRIPRPLVSNLFLFSFILLLIHLKKDQKFNFSNSLFLGLILGFTLNSFFYFFLFEIFCYIIFLFFYYEKKLFFHIFKNLKFYLSSIIVFSLFLFIFIVQITYGEIDYSHRIGLINIDEEKKIIIINYLLAFFLEKEFVALFAINLLIFYFLRKNNKENSLLIFYYLFLSTIFSTIIFIVFSNKGIDYYHFFNWILTSGALFIILFLIHVYSNFFNNLNIKYYKIISIFFIVTLIFYFNINFLINSNINSENRNAYGKIITEFKKIKEPDILEQEILTFDKTLFIWLVLNNYKNFSLVPQTFWTPKKNSHVENNLISSFKFLNLDEKDFLLFFKNEKSGWRIKNPNVENFFDRLYMANKLKTFNNSLDFDQSILKMIKNTSPIITHQLAIPNDEFSRLANKFKNFDEEIFPKIILLNTSRKIINNHNINRDKYCNYVQIKNYVIYLSKKVFSNCSSHETKN